MIWGAETASRGASGRAWWAARPKACAELGGVKSRRGLSTGTDIGIVLTVAEFAKGGASARVLDGAAGICAPRWRNGRRAAEHRSPQSLELPRQAQKSLAAGHRAEWATARPGNRVLLGRWERAPRSGRPSRWDGHGGRGGSQPRGIGQNRRRRGRSCAPRGRKERAPRSGQYPWNSDGGRGGRDSRASARIGDDEAGTACRGGGTNTRLGAVMPATGTVTVGPQRSRAAGSGRIGAGAETQLTGTGGQVHGEHALRGCAVGRGEQPTNGKLLRFRKL